MVSVQKMDELKEILLCLFKKERRYYTRKDLRKISGIKGEEMSTLFDEVIDELESCGYIFLEERKGYTLFEYNRRGLAFGEIEVSKNGCGYVHTKEGYKIFIDKDNLNSALSGDSVIVGNIKPKGNIYQGEVLRVTKRQNPNVFMKVVKKDGLNTLVPYNSRFNIPVTINKNDMRGLVDGEIIAVEVPTGCVNGTFEGSFVKVLGHESDPDTDIKVIAGELGIETEFSEAEMEEARKMPTEVSEEERKGRKDLRDKEFFTIDCDNTKDRDDAVCTEKLLNGNYKLYVAISSVNHYIKPGMALYEGYKKRCTSHYPNNKCIPALPHTISNGICSLNEKVDRLVKVCEMEIDPNGNVVKSNVYNAVINSKKEMCYSDVNDLLDGKEVPHLEPFRESLFTMNELSNILSRASKNRKYLDFNIPEIEAKRNNEDKYELYENKQGNAQKLIENFMVITDNTVARMFMWLPIIYRIHENPNDELVNTVIDRIKKAGGHIAIPRDIDAAFIKKLLAIINKNEDLQDYNTVLLKAMAKAKYSIDNAGHFALQLEEYCHFTSPIRRIADFMVHTIIDEAEEHGYDPEFIEMLEKEAYEVAGKASSAERLDKKFESEAKKMAMAEIMQEHIGETFPGHVVDISGYGMFVRTDTLIDGRIALRDISPDAYYNEEADAILANKGKERYRIGTKVNILVSGASKEERTIDYTLVRERKKKKKS